MAQLIKADESAMQQICRMKNKATRRLDPNHGRDKV